MQVTETQTDGLQRQFSIKLPATAIEQTLQQKLAELSQQVRIPGFRPGKIPMPILKQRYGAAVMGEVVEKAVNDGSQKALTDRGLRAAEQPKIELNTYEPGQDLQFTLSVEVMPEVEPGDLKGFSFERVTVQVSEEEVQQQLDVLAKRIRRTAPVATDRAAQMGDVLVISFDGSVDGERRPGMQSDRHELELGSNSFIDTFEEQLVGSKKGDKREVAVTFPDGYHAPELSGKKAIFAIEVFELREPQVVTQDDAFAEELGAKSLADLKEKVSEQIKRSYDSMSRLLIKRALMDNLASRHSFEVPKSLLEGEFNGIWSQVKADKEKGELSDQDKAKSEEQLEKDYRGIAERRVRLGLLLAEIGRRNKITVKNADINAALMQEARRFPGQEQQVFEFYARNPRSLERIRAPLFEEAVVDFVLTQATVTEKTMTADELRNAVEELNQL